ncbi:glucuronate isomerase [Stieleria varia]|nr:glucuronate isomerase [Stieleria varia]
MPNSLRDSIHEAISSIRLVDPHTHINPHDPGSHTLADILGYHYYTELVHSAGMPQAQIEEPGISPRELVGRLVKGLPNIQNTANYQWLIEICQTFFDFDDNVITSDNWESLYDTAQSKMNAAQWPEIVLEKSNVESVFLTNDFDDDLQGFDTRTYIPCLRTDDLVFHLAKPETRERLSACSGIAIDGSLSNLRAALNQRFEHFVASGARACAISIPPSFAPTMVSDGRAAKALDHVLTHNLSSEPSHVDALSRRVFWTIAELCDEYGLPFDLMIGVNRRVYPKGVYQGQDLYDSRVSLIQYRELFNAFPDLKFPVSVLASVTNQELVSYSWIFPNVLTNGHWWYSNTPSFIKRDAAARLEAVPQNKQIGYYSDAYKLEFVLPKFGMYRRILAGILADYFVGDCGWSEERAIELGHRVLRGNVDDVFRSPLEALEPEGDGLSESVPSVSSNIVSSGTEDTVSDIDPLIAGVAAAGAVAGTMMKSNSDPQPTLDFLSDDDESPSAVSDSEDAQGDSGISSELADFLASDSVDDPDSGDSTLDLKNEKTVGPQLGTVAEDESFGESFGAMSDDDSTASDSADDSNKVSDDGELAVIDDELLDPLPTDDEISLTSVGDVELTDASDELLDAQSLELEIDPLPLDVGDLSLDDESSADSVAQSAGDKSSLADSEIRMLSGDGAFTPGDEELLLKTDPLTGELQFPVSDSPSADDGQWDLDDVEVIDLEVSGDPAAESSGDLDESSESDPSGADPSDDDDLGFGQGVF